MPDGDTGTNMALTLAAVGEELDGGRRRPRRRLQGHQPRLAHGRAGQLRRDPLPDPAGHRRAWSPRPTALDAASGAAALAAAAKAAYEAVMRPVEGTILTVVREASEAAVDGGRRRGRPRRACSRPPAPRAPTRSSARPTCCPVLKDAGVVDAGGTGFLLLLDVLLHVADGRPVPEPTEVEGPVFTEPLPGHGEGGEHGDISDLRYEVMYFLEAHDDAIPAFKDVWAGIGDSIVVVGGDGIWNCHIHTDDIGASIEAAIDIGTPRKIRVTDLIEQVEEERWVREAAERAVDEVPDHLRTPVTCAVVAVATGDGHPPHLPLARRAGDRHRRPVDEPVDRRAARGGRGGAGRPGRDPAEQQEHHPGGRAGRRPHRPRRCASCPPRGSPRASPPCSPTTPRPTATPTPPRWPRRPRTWWPARSPRPCATRAATSGPIATGDWLGIARDGIRAVEADLGDAATMLLAELVCRATRSSRSSRARAPAPAMHPPHHRVARPSTGPAAAAEVHHGGQPLYPYLFGIE